MYVCVKILAKRTRGWAFEEVSEVVVVVVVVQWGELDVTKKPTQLFWGKNGGALIICQGGFSFENETRSERAGTTDSQPRQDGTIGTKGKHMANEPIF